MEQRTDGARVIQVIETNLERRGDGRGDGDPIRAVTQYYALDGQLLAERDAWRDGQAEAIPHLHRELQSAQAAREQLRVNLDAALAANARMAETKIPEAFEHVVIGETRRKVVKDVVAERQRQLTQEGYTADRDALYHGGELALAAAVYATHGLSKGVKVNWPWGKNTFKPKTYRQDLVRAAALVIAELERIDRQAAGMKP